MANGNGNAQAVDYDALAKKYGATSSAQPSVDYDALAQKHGAISSQTPPQEPAAPPSMWDRVKSGAETFVNTMPVVGDIRQAAGAVQDWAAKKIAPDNSSMASPAATFGYGALRDTAGLVRGATSPAGLAATVGTVALPEVAAAALIAHGVYSGVKGWGDLANPDVLQSELNAGAEVAGGAALGGAAIKAGGGPVTQAVRGAVKGAPPVPTDDIRMAIPPSKSAPYQDADLQVAHRYLKVEHGNSPIESVTDLRDSADTAIGGIEDKIAGYIRANPQAQIASGPTLSNVVQALRSNPRGASFVRAGLKELDDFQLNQPKSLAEADAIRRQLNYENKAVLAKNNYDVATARATDPGFTAREAAAESLRNGIYDALDQAGISDARSLRLDEGSLIKIRNAAQNQIFNGDKVVSSSAVTGPVRQAAKAITKAGLTAGGAAIGGVPGALAGSAAGETAGSFFTPQALTRDALVERSFAGGGAPSPRMPLSPVAAGSLAAQSGLVRDPVTGRMLRLADLAPAGAP